MKKHISIIILSILSISLLFSGCQNSANAKSQTNSTEQKSTQKKIITDAAGEKVEIPSKINKIADGWPAHNEVVTMLGYGNKIVSTILSKKAMPWLYVVNPNMNKALVDFTNEDVDTEQLLKTKPDIVFLPLNSKSAAKIKELGIPAVQLNFTDYESLKQCFKLTGQILGSDAEKKSSEYISYLDNNLKKIKAVTDKIPEDKKLKVLHLTSFSPITVDGSNTMIDSWIKAAGGINAASEITGNNKEASMEQIIKWNPDVIIISSNTLTDTKSAVKNINDLYSNPQWSQIKAIQDKKIYINPSGAYLWDRYGADEALQFQWAAKTLYPSKFKNLNMTSITKTFYKDFLNYDLTTDQTNRMLKGLPPANN